MSDEPSGAGDGDDRPGMGADWNRPPEESQPGWGAPTPPPPPSPSTPPPAWGSGGQAPPNPPPGHPVPGGAPGYQPTGSAYQPPGAFGSPYGYGGAAPGPPPPNYLVHAILATLFCCLPFGIVAIVYAAQVSSKWAAGDAHGAYAASRNARMWSVISFAVGLVAVALWLALIAIGSGTGSDSGY